MTASDKTKDGGSHTPGPWEVRELSGALWVYPVAGHGTGWVGDSYMSVCMGSDHGAEANARLVAAAPTMLDALLSTRDSLQAMADEGIIAEGSWPTIDAAISKATGDA